MSEVRPDGHLNFDISDTPVPKRGRLFVDKLNEFFYDYDHRLPEQFFTGSISGTHINNLSIARVTCDPLSVWRTKTHITRDAIDGYFVLLPSDHAISLSQRNREAQANGKQFALVSTSDAYTYIQKDTTTFNNVIIPGDVLRDVAPRVDDAVASQFGHRPIDRLFRDYSHSLCGNLYALDLRAASVGSGQLVELLGLVLDGVDYASRAAPVQAAHRHRINQLIDQHFSDPAFGTQWIAARLQLSPRYIQAILARDNETLTDLLHRRRVLAARHLIQARVVNRLSIADIAAKVGYKDLAHFSRVFKRETGYAPTQLPRSI